MPTNAALRRAQAGDVTGPCFGLSLRNAGVSPSVGKVRPQGNDSRQGAFVMLVSRRSVELAVRTAEPCEFVLQLQFSTLELGEFRVVEGWVGRGLLEFPLQRVMLALELSQVVLKRHSAFSSVTNQ